MSCRGVCNSFFLRSCFVRDLLCKPCCAIPFGFWLDPGYRPLRRGCGAQPRRPFSLWLRIEVGVQDFDVLGQGFCNAPVGPWIPYSHVALAISGVWRRQFYYRVKECFLERDRRLSDAAGQPLFRDPPLFPRVS